MTDDEDFLSRWSRRKRAAMESMVPSPDAADTPAALPSSGEAAAVPHEPREASQAEASQVNESEREEFDPASLPSIDSIVESTDISGFLKRGVPLDLTRAALRRAWSTDPAIRDFIGLAENAWDFNDPNAMPGFGPLDQSPDEIRQMLAQVMGEVRCDPEVSISFDDAPVTQSAQVSNAITDSVRTESPIVGEPVVTENADSQSAPVDKIPARPREDVAMQKERSANGSDAPDGAMLRRTHGGALPR